jgi:hypothetical protein
MKIMGEYFKPETSLRKPTTFEPVPSREGILGCAVAFLAFARVS